MKSTIILFTMLMSPAAVAVDNLALRVNSEAYYQIAYTTWGISRTQTVWDLHRGSGVHLQRGDRHFIATAAHVVVGIWPPASLTVNGTSWPINREYRLADATFRVRVDEVSLVPISLALAHEQDLALLEIAAKDVPLLTAKPLDLQLLVTLHLQDQVRCWGFPGTAAPSVSRPMDITACDDLFCVAADRTEPGQSGGPVLLNQQFFGLVSRSDDKQTRIIAASKVFTLLEHFDALKVVYQDALKIEQVVR